jgi:hypothetical protein
MGLTQSIQKINFEDVQKITKTPDGYVMINTLPESEQGCLLLNTVPAHQEEYTMNELIQRNKKNIHIIIYGRNSNDEGVYKKYHQLTKMGFYNISLYPGGMFEWLMLQDIFGFQEFMTTKKELDFLKYKPRQALRAGLIGYGS